MNVLAVVVSKDPSNSKIPFLMPATSLIARLNSRCDLHEMDGLRVAMMDGDPFQSWPVGDRVAEELFAIHAQMAGFCTMEQAATALGHDVRTLYRSLARYRNAGAAGLIRRPGPRTNPSVQASREAAIVKLHADGLSHRAIAQRLRVGVTTVHRVLDRRGLRGRAPSQRALPMARCGVRPGLGAEEAEPCEEPPDGSAASPASAADADRIASGPTVGSASAVTGATRPALDAPASSPVLPVSLDTDPLNRVVDRARAAQGEIRDAAPLFANGAGLPFVGVLLAVPGLVASGLCEEAARLYANELGPAFYGLRTSLVALVLLSLLRLKRPENLKEYAPPDLGRVLGLDRAPEVKTLRRKLHRLAEGAGEHLIAAVAARRAHARDDAMAFLLVDGHVRVYNGKEKLPEAHVARMRISMPATQDVWVNDADGCPLLFVTQEAHPSLASALPPVLAEVREAVGSRRVTVVFDRGGWSPALFRQLEAAGFDVLTYRKGNVPVDDGACFEDHAAPDGGSPWNLQDVCVRVGADRLPMRQVTRLRDGHRTAILTSRHDLSAVEVAQRMFGRWKQENFFKYMREEFALDALVEYGAEDDDPLRDVPNPARSRIDKELRLAKAVLGRLLLAEDDPADPHVVAARERLAEIKTRRDAVTARTTVGALENPPVRLPACTKRVYDTVKTVAWQIETDLARAISPFYKRSTDDGRTLLAAAFRSRGDLEVGDDELRVTLAPLSSPHRTRALVELCAILDRTETRFPGTRLRLRYAVRTA